MTERTERFSYDDAIVRKFTIATLIWAGVALLLGVIIASQLASWKMNFGLPWLSFGRLRPLHTNAAIFAFGGNAIFAGVYYSSQRLLKARLASDFLSRLHFWGWQAIIVAAAVTLPLGYTSGKEYAELEWPIDLAIAVVWLAFGVNLFMTVFKRREKHIYVAIWFYLATFITVTLLHVVNSLVIPASILKSYPIYAGVQDAMVQWWYGHNAVAFFLTTPFLGLMYYFIPKAANRPVYSYKLSVIHFWTLVFIYIWAGPHHLLYTSLPEWAQTVGMVCSLMLWIPSWGGMINGLLTLRGGWDRVRSEPVLKFLVAATTFYGMSTFEGPLLSIKSVNAIAHYTDWIIGHVHSGALGWNGFLAFGMIYYLVPKLWKTKLHSEALANTHFWLGTAGIVLYMMSMWASGITQGLMLQAVDPSGRLQYPDFAETVMRILPLYWIRLSGGLLFLTGFLVMAFNIWKTIASGAKDLPDEAAEAPALSHAHGREAGDHPHRYVEALPGFFGVLILLAIIVGSLAELVPMILATDARQMALQTEGKIRPLTSLEVLGRDIYIREGCYVCHSQQIRPLTGDVARYGAPSTLAESQYDHPFQWGSRRTGPDLARVGAKYPHLWHFKHMRDPRDVIPQSIMPEYGWLHRAKSEFSDAQSHLRALRRAGVPYSEAEVTSAEPSARAEAARIATKLEADGGPLASETQDREIIPLIAYLQSLGQQHVTVSRPRSTGGAP